MHPRAVECAKENGTILHVRSSFSRDEGTRIKEKDAMELNRSVTGIALKKDEAKISVVGVNDQPGAAGTLFTELGKHNVNIDMIIQSNEEQNETNTITFTVSEDDYEEAKKVTEQVAKTIGGTSC